MDKKFGGRIPEEIVFGPDLLGSRELLKVLDQGNDMIQGRASGGSENEGCMVRLHTLPALLQTGQKHGGLLGSHFLCLWFKGPVVQFQGQNRICGKNTARTCQVWREGINQDYYSK